MPEFGDLTVGLSFCFAATKGMKTFRNAVEKFNGKLNNQELMLRLKCFPPRYYLEN